MFTGIDFFVFLFKSTNFELAAILKTTTIKKAGIYHIPLASVTYGKYATRVPDVVTYMDSSSVLVL